MIKIQSTAKGDTMYISMQDSGTVTRAFVSFGVTIDRSVFISDLTQAHMYKVPGVIFL